MVKKIGISICLIILGFVISVVAESELRHLIQTLFKKNGVYFYGKDFYLFASPFYYLSFGLLLMLIFFSWNRLTPRQKAIDVVLTMVIFFIGIGIVSWLISTKMIVECTACNDGTRGIPYNDISYDGIIIGSLFLSMIPSGIRLVPKRKAV